MDDQKADSIRFLERIAEAEGRTRCAWSTDWLDPGTLEALGALRAAVQDVDMRTAVAGVADPPPGHALEAHQRLRQVAALTWILGQVTNAEFCRSVADMLMDFRAKPGRN